MEEHTAVADDQSHYEISLTAGQAFVAFVLLLLSLAASFAFGLMLGKGQADERLVVQKEPAVITEASLGPKKSEGQIVDVGGHDDCETPRAAAADDAAADAAPAATPAETASAPADALEGEPAEIVESAPAPVPAAAAVTETPKAAAPAPAATAAAKVPHFAQLLSTGDQKTAEAMAVKLIDRGFNTAYVERGTTSKGPVYRVRVKFESEPDARAAEPKLKEFAKDIWITAR
jgi:cell division septation protein DedD